MRQVNWRRYAVGLALVGLGLLTVPNARAQFEQVPGFATAIAIGGDGSIWIAGTAHAEGGYVIYRWDGRDWQPTDGPGAVRVAADADGNPWVVNASGRIFRQTRDGWVDVPGRAVELAIGADGTPWMLGGEEREDGFEVFRWDGRDWHRVRGAGGIRIAVGPGGDPWVITKRREILHLRRERWERFPGSGIAMGVGGDGALWLVGTQRAQWGNVLLTWDGESWQPADGQGIAVAVTPNGRPWVINNANGIYRLMRR